MPTTTGTTPTKTPPRQRPAGSSRSTPSALTTPHSSASSTPRNIHQREDRGFTWRASSRRPACTAGCRRARSCTAQARQTDRDTDSVSIRPRSLRRIRVHGARPSPDVPTGTPVCANLGVTGHFTLEEGADQRGGAARDQREHSAQRTGHLRVDRDLLDIHARVRALRRLASSRGSTRRRSLMIRRHPRFAVVRNHPPSASGSRIWRPCLSSAATSAGRRPGRRPPPGGSR